MGNKCSCSYDNEPEMSERDRKKRERGVKLDIEIQQISKIQCSCPKNDTDNKSEEKLVRANTLIDPLDTRASLVNPEEYNFPFENLIFEGGGNKGLAYAGSLECLEKLGIMSQIKRVGGSSAGAITAALVALGYSSRDIFQFMSENIEEVFLDHSCGYLSLLPNLLRKYGWNPGRKIYTWLGNRIKAKTNNPDYTFLQLYKEKKKELCVVVTNLNQIRTEYCHPKTTPDMPIRVALRMSMAIPGVFMARNYNNHGTYDTYVDGGVLCNYPIHCFDGWYLSMDRKDAFLLHFQSLSDLPKSWAAKSRFIDTTETNHKTIGFLLYDDSETEVMRYSLDKRIGACLPLQPSKETKLYKHKEDKKKVQNNFEREHSRVVKAVEAFMKALHKHNLEDHTVIDKEELKNALADTEVFSQTHRELLFGIHVDVDTAFSILDKDGNGQIDFLELVQFMEERGIRVQSRIQEYGRRDVKSFMQFLSALQNAWTTNLKYVFVEDADVDRTVGINTGHVGTSNYVLEDEDKDFITKRGYNATKTFLKYFVVSKPDLVTKKDGTSVSNNITTDLEPEHQDVIDTIPDHIKLLK